VGYKQFKQLNTIVETTLYSLMRVKYI